MIGKSKAWALALLVGVLLMGGVAGAAIDRMLVGRSAAAQSAERRDADRDHRRSYVDWLAAELELTDEQRTSIEGLLEGYREQVSGQWQEMRPRFEEMREQFRSEVRTVLTQEQIENYEALLSQEAERRHSRRGRQ
jgi:hypothetical protein